MKLLAHVHGYGPIHNAGAEMMLHHTLRWFVERGHECIVLTPPQMLRDGLAEDVIEGVVVRGHWTQAQQDQWYREADVIITHLDLSPRVSRWAAKAGRPVVHIIHNPTSLNVYPLEEGHVDLAIFNSYSLAMAHYKINPPATVLYPPVFARDYTDLEEADPASRVYHTLLNLNENKGGPFMGTLAQMDVTIPYQAVGGCYDQQHIPHSPNILFTAHTSDVLSVYRRTKVLLVPSHSETWGRVAIEAMHHGIPVIANSECVSEGFREALEDAVVWAPRSSPAAWMDAIRGLGDPVRYHDYQIRGKRRAQTIEDRTHFQLACLERHLATMANKFSRGKVHFIASEEHYLRHISGVAHTLPPERRGLVIVAANLRRKALLEGHMVIAPESTNHIYQLANPQYSLTYCVSYKDHQKARDLGYPVVRAEHGAGQTYCDLLTNSFAGSEDHRSAFLCLYPGYSPLKQHIQRLGKPAFLVGAPILDRWIAPPRDRHVGFAFHWDCQNIPETRETLSYWAQSIESSIMEMGSDYTFYMHAHPRFPHAKAVYNAMVGRGCPITWIEDRDTFLSEIGVLVADNTSLVFEACAHDRVAVVLNHPGYRRNVEHGLRFWEASDVGIQCDSLADLPDCIRQASQRFPEDVDMRDSALEFVYAKDRPTQRTCAYLLSALEDLGTRRSGAPTVTIRALRDFDTGVGHPVMEGSLRIMLAGKAKEYVDVGMIEILDEQVFRDIHLSRHSCEEGLWRLLVPMEDKIYRVVKSDEVEGKKIRPGEILLAGDVSKSAMTELQSREAVVKLTSSAPITNREKETKCAS